MTGGHPQSLARAERTLGLDSWAVSFSRTVFDYPTDEVLFNEGDGLLRKEVKRWRFLRRAMREFDVFHFNFGTSIMPRGFRSTASTLTVADHLAQWYVRAVELLDLRWLKWAGKKIFVTFQGDDARQGDYCRAYFPIHFAHEVGQDYYSPELDARKRKWIATFDRYADGIFNLNPDLSHVLPERTEFVPYAHVNPREWIPCYPTVSDGKRLTIVHAPTHRAVKGTKYVIEAVERLRREVTADIDFILVEGYTNEQARQLYAQADLLVDQLLARYYGGLTVELMALGKPVICYLEPADFGCLPAGMRRDLPIISATPATIFETLKSFVTTRRRELPEIGRRSRKFVEVWHDPLKIAARMSEAYTTNRQEESPNHSTSVTFSNAARTNTQRDCA